MGAVKLATWAFVILVGSATLYLAWLNRASEKVAINLPTALAVSAVGALLTLVFSLQPEEQSSSFVVEYIIDRRQGLPLTCEAFPDAVQYTDAGGRTTSPGWLVAPAVAKARNEGQPASDEALARLYRDVLTRQLLDDLRFTFLKSWDAQPSRIELPSGGSSTLFAPRVVRAGKQLPNAELAGALGGSAAVESDNFKFLNLPPDTKVAGAVEAERTTLRLTNPFVAVELSIAQRGVEKGPGTFRELCRLSFADAEHFSRPRYVMSLTARFSEFRSGHPDMPLYRHWFAILEGEMQRFDSGRRWEVVKERYLLLYANRTKTPLQELMDETLQKAKSSAPDNAAAPSSPPKQEPK